METKDPKSTETTNNNTQAEAVEPESTATSSDTLSDLEQAEKDTSGGADSGGGSASEAPSPDGQFDESGSDKSGVGDPGPM
jgi:hypothetical protein